METQKNNENGKENDKEFKESSFAKGFTIIIGILVVILLIWSFGYLIMKKINESSSELISLYIALISLYGFIIMSVIKHINLNSDKEDSEKISLFPGIKSKEDAIIISLILIFGIPILVLGIAAVSFLLNLWYYLIATYILGVLFLYIISGKNIFFKILAFLLVLSSLYFGFKAREIIQFKFQVIYEDERIL
ncbi:hypothetical protein FEDK69T_12120 [Flavobacterium enshiense DK69]|uniref:Uncharacterized protein n=1 Tax=Flavobacterium enshiense DK69 TaxID=1107311 RepID=V6SB05_9FLAO|nr:hypothetical protein [Flavobacterium enshiense]ESU23801.1 hypothetical protein FEDK69T_12120 [Flavobacterium enshiense DK69]KGO96069.1 hypothetical protein Q767_07345 [Flavobacterium enshiense DK69]